MSFYSPKTEKGNVGYSEVSMELAILQAEDMDRLGCTNCDYCTNCINCTNCDCCTNCTDWHTEAKNILSIHGLYWPVGISNTHMKIGCQFYHHEAWKNFSEAEISEMHPKALEFWNKNKDLLLGFCNLKASEVES